MPYKLQRSGRGYFVVTKGSGRRHSKSPLPKTRAMAQMRALYAAENGYVLRRSSRSRPASGRRGSRRRYRR